MKIRERLSAKKITAMAICGTLILGAVGISAAQKSSAQTIGPDKATEVALQDAGVAQNETHKMTNRYDREDGLKVYEVDFYANGVEYDYTIAADDGRIVDVKKEKMDAEDYREAGLEVPQTQVNTPAAERTPTQTQTPASTTQAQTTPTYIGEDAAKSAALTHAGVAAADATFERIELDRDNGRLKYEVDFYTADMEYDYEINAETGAVVEADKERRDYD